MHTQTRGIWLLTVMIAVVVSVVLLTAEASALG